MGFDSFIKTALRADLNLLICTLGGNRTHTSEETGFWIQRVYQFRHQGKWTAKLVNILCLTAGFLSRYDG